MRTSNLSLRVSSLSAGIALLALALSGCGRTAAPVSPAAGREPESALRAGIAGAGGLAQGGHSANLFYPLELGNHWGYDHALGLYTIPIGGPPGPVFGLNDRHNFDIVCIEQLAGRSYFIERESFPGGVSIWSRIRQDGAGLYAGARHAGDDGAPAVQENLTHGITTTSASRRTAQRLAGDTTFPGRETGFGKQVGSQNRYRGCRSPDQYVRRHLDAVARRHPAGLDRQRKGGRGVVG